MKKSAEVIFPGCFIKILVITSTMIVKIIRDNGKNIIYAEIVN